MNDEPSYVRDALSYSLAEKMGNYAPRTKYCEVIVNDDYRGLYFLTEKIKIDDKRVDVLKMDSSSNAVPEVTGGYIIKADKTTGGDVPAWSTPAYDYWENVDYIFHNPKPEEITDTEEKLGRELRSVEARIVAAEVEQAARMIKDMEWASAAKMLRKALAYVEEKEARE